MNSFYSKEELMNLGFKSLGENVFISKKVSIYNPYGSSIGNNVRIDDFCILSGKVNVGNYIHIAAYSCLYGAEEGITIKDFANISSKVSIYAISDDFTGESMTNPMVPEKYKKLIREEVIIDKHVLIGSGCVILPGVKLGEGSCFGALTLINKNSDPWTVNIGIPSKKIKNRSRKLLDLEKNFIKDMKI